MNPYGRPKGSKGKKSIEKAIEAMTIKELVLPHCEKAIQVLVDLLSSKNESIRMATAQNLLDRGYGKAIQAVENKTLIAIVDQSPLEVARKAAYLLDNAERIESEIKQLN